MVLKVFTRGTKALTWFENLTLRIFDTNPLLKIPAYNAKKVTESISVTF